MVFRSGIISLLLLGLIGLPSPGAWASSLDSDDRDAIKIDVSIKTAASQQSPDSSTAPLLQSPENGSSFETTPVAVFSVPGEASGNQPSHRNDPQPGGVGSTVRFSVPGGTNAGGLANSSTDCTFTIYIGTPDQLDYFHAAGGKGILVVQEDCPPSGDVPTGYSVEPSSDSRVLITGLPEGATFRQSHTFEFDYGAGGGIPQLGAIRVLFGNGFYTDVYLLQAGSIGCGDTRTGTALAGPNYYFTTLPFEFSASAGNVVVVHGVTGRLVTSNDAVDLGAWPVIVRLPSTGTYVIKVQPASLPNGSYTLSLQFTKGGTCGSPIDCGQTIAGAIGTQDQLKAYRFSGSAGEAIYPLLFPTGTFSGVFHVKIYGPDGEPLNNNAEAEFRRMDTPVILPQTGTYTAIVYNLEDKTSGSLLYFVRGTGSYNFGLQFATGRCALDVACGQTVSGNSQGAPEHFDLYKFSGALNEISITPTSVQVPEIGILDPTGKLLSYTLFGVSPSKHYAFSTSGQYVAVVRSSSPSSFVFACQGVCNTFLLSKTASSVNALGGRDSLTVTTGTLNETDACCWSSSSPVPWMRFISGGAACRSGGPAYAIDSNQGSSARTATLTIASQPFVVRQAGTCTVALSPTGISFASSGGIGTIQVIASGNCGWAAVPDVPSPLQSNPRNDWVTITSTGYGTGNGTVTFKVDSFAKAGARFRSIAINKAIFTITQSGVCGPISISPGSQTFGASGGDGSINVSAPDGCAWNVDFTSSSQPSCTAADCPDLFLSTVSPTLGNGSGNVSYSLASNPRAAPRSGTIFIGGQGFTIYQAGSQADCGSSLAVSPAQESFGAGGGTSTASVSATGGCAWSAETNASWVHVVSSANGQVTYSVDPLTSRGRRQGTFSVFSGQTVKTFAVEQEGLGCIYSISPAGRLFGTAGGSGTVGVTTLPGCGWTAVSNSSWINVVAGSSGTGNGTASYTVNSTAGTSNQNGTITIAGQTFTVVRAGVASGTQISAVTVDPFVISPNGDGTNDSLTLQFNLSAPDQITVEIFDHNGALVATPLNAVSLGAGAQTATWNGSTSAGPLAADGTYNYRIRGASAPAVTGPFGVNNTIPDTSRTWFVAEGSTVGFDCYILVQNPNPIDVPVTFTFIRQDGTTKIYNETVGPLSRITVPVHAQVPNTYSVSTYVEAPYPVLVERAMYFNSGQAGTDSPAINATSKNWYFPANDTFPGEEDFILVTNSSDSPAQLTVTYLFASSPPATQNHTVTPHSRFTIPVHGYYTGEYVSVQLASDLPVAAEEAFYINNRAGGLAGIGAVSPSLTWYFAEGDTSSLTTAGSAATTRLDVMNPGQVAANLTVNYLLENGSVISRTYSVAAQRRLSINAQTEVGAGQRFSVEASSTVPVVMSQWMLSGTDVDGTIGSPTTDTNWYLAEGFTAFGYETWVIISNPGTDTASVKVRFHKQNTQNIVRYYAIGPKQRLTVYVNSELDEETSVSTQVTSDKPVVVERTMKFVNRQGLHQAMGVR